jgi:malonate transporter and related proteins
VGPSGVLAVVVGNLVTSLIMIPLTLVLVQIGQGGKSAAGVALFTLGLMLYGQRLHVDLDITLNALLKNIGQPAAMLGLTLLLGIHGPLAKELFLTGAIPTATAASMLALRYRTYADEAAASTLVSTVGSIVTVTLAIVLAEHLA